MSNRIEQNKQNAQDFAGIDIFRFDENGKIVEQVYNEECATPGLADVCIRKNRNGEASRVGLHFDERRMAFPSIDHRHAGPHPAPKHAPRPSAPPHESGGKVSGTELAN